MSMLFTGIGCQSMQCICQIIADKCRIIRNLSDPKDIQVQNKELENLVGTYDRMKDEQENHTPAVVYPEAK